MHHHLFPIIAPFAGYKLRCDAQFNPAPRLAAIDILTPGHERYDVDVREVIDEGVLIFHGMPTLDFVRWEDIRCVRVASLDADWNRTAVREYRADALQVAA